MPPLRGSSWAMARVPSELVLPAPTPQLSPPPLLSGCPERRTRSTAIWFLPRSTQFPIGEEAIVFITNRTNANGLGFKTGVVPYYSNVIDNGPAGAASNFGTANPIGQLFGGVNCSGTSVAFGHGGALPGGVLNFAVNPQLREPLSGTMNTTEFTALNTFGGTLNSDTYGIGTSSVENSPFYKPGTSQEANVLGAANNPLNAACVSGLGTRRRTVGSGEEVGKPGGTGVGLTQDSIGYTFFAFGNEAPIGGNPNYGYLTRGRNRSDLQ